MSVLSFDVSVRSTGWSVLENDSIVGMGLIPTKKETPLETAVEILLYTTRQLCEKFSPDVVMIENSFFGSNIKILKQLEACRWAVKVACFESTGNWPIESLASEYRSKFELSSKEDVFEYVKKLSDFKFMSFSEHNDITDSLLLGMSFSRRAKESENNTSKCNEQIKSLLGIISSNKCAINNKYYMISDENEESIITKYINIPDFIDSPICYDKIGHCRFYICKKEDIDFSLFDLRSLYFVLSDSIFSRGKFVCFRTSSVFSKVPDEALKHLHIRRLKKLCKIEKSVFLKELVPKLKKEFTKEFGRKGINALLKGAKL